VQIASKHVQIEHLCWQAHISADIRIAVFDFIDGFYDPRRRQSFVAIDPSSLVKSPRAGQHPTDRQILQTK
jgi:hypothetical protein